VGWVRLSQRPVERRARGPLAGRTARRSVRVSLFALVCGLLVSCGGEPRLAPPANSSQPIVTNTPQVGAATPAATSMAPRVGDIVWATATDPTTNAPIDPVSTYRPDALRIVAAMRLNTLSAGSVVEATWEYNDTSLDAFTTQLTLAESGADQWISFYIERDPEVEWPVGTYAVNLSVDGTPVQQAAVEVRTES
jgi:hypothetical protein